ncbi:MAG TPA: protoporphyrinogen oxidase [Candidatus Binataceae bacterium]|nr:protoporphyrinogen oxidase [Candidatus Binataceae bacterium]
MAAGQSRRIVVIGGGITGLAAAYRLREFASASEAPVEVILLEAGNRLGGALETVYSDGFTIETGADSFLSEKPAAMNLAERLGLTRTMVRTQEQFRKTLVVRNGRLVEIPAGFSLLAPTYFAPILRSPLFSLGGKLRMLLEPLVPRRRATTDESLGALVTRRLGRQVLERIAQPLAAGIYTADPAQLSASATMPRFVEMERRYGSLILGLRAAARGREAESRRVSGARWSLFVSFSRGIGTLVEALAASLGDVVLRGRRVVALARKPSDGWKVLLAGGAEIDADAIICTTPAASAAKLVRSHDAALSAQLDEIRYASAATVNLAFNASDFAAPPAVFGFVVPAAERRNIIAGSFSSLKFAGRAPADKLLARVFIGGAFNSAILARDDDALIATARAEFESLLGVTATPLLAHVRRWPDSMPQYALGHLDRVHSIRARVARLSGLILAGAYLDGVGIPDCVRQGEAAAEIVIGSLADSGK